MRSLAARVPTAVLLAASAALPAIPKTLEEPKARLSVLITVLLALAAALLLLADGHVAQAQSTTPTRVVPQNWSLTPPGLVIGDQFRLLFLSSTKTEPDSGHIADYNAFVQNLAAAGHADIRDFSAGFRAVACVGSGVNARGNTGTSYTTTDKGVPIYWLNGNKAADDYEDFYDGSWDDEANDRDETGHDGRDTSQINNRPITGCDHNGTHVMFRALGDISATVGHLNSSDSGAGPLSSNTSYVNHTALRPMYGLSQVFEVGAATNAMGQPQISGVAQEGELLRAGVGAIADTDGLPSTTFPAGYSFQWVRVDADGVSNPTRVGRDDVEYTLEVADVGKRIKVEVTFTDGGGTEETLPSDAYPSAPQGVTAPPHPEVTVSYEQASYTVTERQPQSEVVTISLSAVPWREVVIPIGTTDQDGATSADYTVAPTSVTFGPTDTVKEITFAAARDAVDDDGESVRLTFGDLPTGVSAGSVPETIVSITDDYGPGVTVYPTLLHIDEGGGAKGYTVVLDTQPTAEVTVRAISNSTVTTGFDRNLTFTTGNWNIPQRVSIATPQDDDTDGQHLGMIHSATGGGYGSVDVDRVDIRFTDPDVRGEISLGEVQPVEEDAGTVRVEVVAVTVQEGAPRTDYAMRVTSSRITAREGSDYEGVNERVDFPNGDFTAFVNDDGETRYRQTATFDFNILNDGIAEDTETFALFLGSAGGDYAGERAGVGIIVVTINDNDPLGVTVDPGTLEIDEGNSDTYDVVLDTQPAGPVTVTIEGITDADLSLDKATLTFTGLDWNVPQTVTVTAEQDDDQVNEPAVILTHTLSSLEVDFDDLSAADVTVSVTDDDPPVQMEYSLVEAGPFEEDAGTVQVEVVAVTNEAGVPNTEYAVGVQSEDVTANSPGDYAEVDETLDFPLGDFAAFVNDVGDTRYRQTVSFDVVIADDRFDEGTETFRLKLSESPEYEGSVFGVPEIEVTINDNDTAGVTVTPTELKIEEGNSDTYDVVLDTQPSSDVTVTINDPANPEITAEPASWTFTPDNWDEPRTVTVTADHDNDRIDEAAATITHTVTSTFDQYNDLSADSVTVTVTDGDVLSVAVSFEHSSYEVAESDDATTVDKQENEATVKVTLSADPEREVIILIETEGQGGASDADYSGVPTSVTFHSGEMSKSFTFTAADDGEDDDGESVKLTFGTPPKGVNAGSVPETIVTITDDDLPASVTVSFSSPTYPVTEGGGVEVTVNLSEDPERKIVIPISRENLGGATDSDYRGVPPSVTFNAKDISESFTFEAVADNLEDIGESVELGFDGTLPDGVSAGSTSEATVTIADGIAQNSLAVSFEFSEYTLPEGATTMVTVTLNAAPGSEVTIPLVTTGEGETSDADYSGVPASVIFNATDISKSFPFTAEADDVDDDGDSVKLTFGTLPGGVSAGNISVAIVNITDDDTAGVNISETSLEIEEGDSDTYDVALDTEPTGDVTVTIEGATGTDLILDKASLTFTDQNWDALQRVTVTADQDDDAADEAEVTLTHTASSPDDYYDGLKAADVTVRVTDDDPAVEVSFDSATYSATEGGANAVVMVQLSSPAPHRVEIPITAEGSGGAGTDDWSGVPQTVTFDTGDTSESFSVIAFDDTAEDDGEMVELGFGTLPEGFVKGSPHTAKVALMNDDRSEDSTASCDSPVWTASLRLGDQTTADWGQFKLVHQLFHPGPPSSLSADEFEYQDENFVIMSINLVPMVPTGTAARSGPFATPEFASFSIDIDRGEWDGPVSDAQWSGPLRGILKLSIFRVIRPAIFTDIQPPWERGELTIIRL